MHIIVVAKQNFDTQDTNIFNRSKGEYFKVENFEVFQVI